jgi:hypothetical protein
MGNVTPISQRCTHLPPAARGLGPVWCRSCGWVEDGVRITAQQVVATHPELRAQVEATTPTGRAPSAAKGATPTVGLRLAAIGEVIRRLASIRLILTALFGGLLVAIPLSLIARPLGYAFFPVFLLLWIGTALSRDYALYCPHCRKRVKMGADICHHCGRAVH